MVQDRKELYAETLASQLKVWDDEIEHLDARADIILAQVEDRYYCLLKSLRKKERELRESLRELRTSCDDDWEIIRENISRTTSEMKETLGDAEKVLTA
ncbi:MAG: hypothetical protein ABI670_22885 [Chloroflexota bacterium]